MNVKLLRKIQKHILAEPKRYDQNTFGDKVYGNDAPACGTKACIAGWAYIIGKGLDARKVTSDTLWNRADGVGRRLLGLNAKQADRLFSNQAREEYPDMHYVEEGWPRRFWLRYKLAKRPATKARIAAARIEHFIKTKGAE